MTRTFLLSLILAAPTWSQTLSPPAIGFVQDGAHQVRPVHGVAGNFVVGSGAPQFAVTSASSGSFHLIKTDSALLTLDPRGQIIASMNAPDGPALFAFSQDGTPSLAYLASTNTLLQWTGAGFEAATFHPAFAGNGAVVCIASPDVAHAAFLLQRRDGLWDLRVSLATGDVDAQSALMGVNAPALMLPSGAIVFAADLRRSGQSIVIRRPDGSETRLPAELPDAISFQQMGDGWVELRGLGAHPLAIRTATGHERVYRLPETGE